MVIEPSFKCFDSVAVDWLCLREFTILLKMKCSDSSDRKFASVILTPFVLVVRSGSVTKHSRILTLLEPRYILKLCISSPRSLHFDKLKQVNFLQSFVSRMACFAVLNSFS